MKIDPRQAPGGRSTDPADLPAERTAYALRDLEHLRRLAAGHGPAVGAFAGALLDTPLPWTRRRQVYALLGLVKRWGADRVDTACASALAHEAVNVGLIGRMLERGTESTTTQPSLPGVVVPGRFPATPTTSPPAPGTAGHERSGRHTRATHAAARVKLGRCLDTLPERLALAQTGGLGHAEFLELVLADEVTRRETTSADRRARAAGLDPTMTLDRWDDARRSPTTTPCGTN